MPDDAEVKLYLEDCVSISNLELIELRAIRDKYGDTTEAEVERLYEVIDETADRLKINRRTDHSVYETLKKIELRQDALRPLCEEMLEALIKYRSLAALSSTPQIISAIGTLQLETDDLWMRVEAALKGGE